MCANDVSAANYIPVGLLRNMLTINSLYIGVYEWYLYGCNKTQ